MGDSLPRGGVPSFAAEIARDGELKYLKGLAQSMRGDLREIEQRIHQIRARKN
jgi:hypothetical protein